MRKHLYIEKCAYERDVTSGASKTSWRGRNAGKLLSVSRHCFMGIQPQVLKIMPGDGSLAVIMDLYSRILPDTKTEEMRFLKREDAG